MPSADVFLALKSSLIGDLASKIIAAAHQSAV